MAESTDPSRRRIESDEDDVRTLLTRVGAEVHALLERSAVLGFLGGMPVDQQIAHALGFVWTVETELGRAPRSVLDLGTGGGIPGLVLAACWPDSRVVLFDANQRRTEFLDHEVD